ncbi:uncharacterized protein EV154DRAFT_570947 [Mucor mucedo]|uniref:uncharacterized protein n=1 Tax=Mucor mucedo TaxID=29922 RepID=UPI00222003C3|nr:uncharacterized protein EV154DRAFT_570947 [Mucor mucedo]KAI7870082.1 hypothetical protein EV154DRAFT_570947 [Mucor mucedo]
MCMLMLFNVDDLGYFGDRVNDVREATGNTSSNIYNDWNEVCLYVYKDWKNIETICHKVTEHLDAISKIQQTNESVVKFDMPAILKMPKEIQHLVKLLEEFFYYSDPSSKYGLNNSRVVITRLIDDFNNIAAPHYGKSKSKSSIATKRSEDRELVIAIRIITLYALGFTLGLMMAETRTIRKYTAVFTCLLVDYFLIRQDNYDKQQVLKKLNAPRERISPMTKHKNILAERTFDFVDESKELIRDVDILIGDLHVGVFYYPLPSVGLHYLTTMLQRVYKRMQSMANSNKNAARTLLLDSDPSKKFMAL